MAGRSGIATLIAELCRGCMLNVEEAIKDTIKKREVVNAH